MRFENVVEMVEEMSDFVGSNADAQVGLEIFMIEVIDLLKTKHNLDPIVAERLVLGATISLPPNLYDIEDSDLTKRLEVAYANLVNAVYYKMKTVTPTIPDAELCQTVSRQLSLNYEV